MAGENLKNLQASASDAVAKAGLEGVRAEVVLVLDVSRSMFPIYRAKIVQELVPQFCAVALNFDDDGIIPAYAFGDGCRHLRDLRATDFSGWVDREVIRTGSDYQTHCRYAPVIHEVCRYYFPEDWDRPALKESVGRLFKKEQVVYPMLSAPRAYPIFCMFVTGGDCEDEEETADAIRRSSRLPIFWQFIGLSPPGRLTQFRFLKRLDKLGNTHVDNCGFFEVSDTRNDKLLFDGMAREFPSYLEKPEVARMLRPAEKGGRTTKGVRGASHDDEDRKATQLTAMPAEQEEPSVIIDAMLEEEEPDPHRDIEKLKAKFAGVEWAEGTHGGGGAVRAAAPPGRSRRPRPSRASRGGACARASRRRWKKARAPRPRRRTRRRACSSAWRASSRSSATSPSRRRRRHRPSRRARRRPGRARPRRPRACSRLRRARSRPRVRRPSPSRRPPRWRPCARLSSLGEDSGTVAATGDVVDQEGLPPAPPARPQPPPRSPSATGRPQPPPRRPSK
ncbi:MAG: VWA domain-containing protein [Myxococcota bacterium]